MVTKKKQRINILIKALLGLMVLLCANSNPVTAGAEVNTTQTFNSDWLTNASNGFLSPPASSFALLGEGNTIYINNNSINGQWVEFTADSNEGLISFDLTSLTLGKYTTSSTQVLQFTITATKIDNSTVSEDITWLADGTSIKEFTTADFGAMTGIKKYRIDIIDFAASSLEFREFKIANPVLGNNAPTVTGLSASNYQENIVNAAALLLDTDISVSDSDSADFLGGQVIVSYTSAGLAEDQLSVGTIGNISLSDTNVVHSTAGTIGTVLGGASGSNLIITLNSNASAAAVTDLLRALSYQNTSNSPTSYRTISLQVTDGDGGTSIAATAVISVTGQGESGPEAPALTQYMNYTTWTKDLNNGFTVSAEDNNYLGGDASWFWLSNSAGGKITIRSAEQFEGGIFDLSALTFDVYTSAIYTVTLYGHKGDGNTVSTSTTGDTNAEINAFDLSSMVGISSFDIQIERDGSSDTSGLSFVSFTIANPGTYVGNNPPAITGFSSALFQENTVNVAPQQLDTDISLTDTDSADLSGGQITVSYAGTGLAQDQLGVGPIGNISVTSGKINHSTAGELGTISGGVNGANLIITLNSTATAAYATDVLRAITYRNTSNDPSSYRTIRITATDGDGGTSPTVTALISVSGQADAGVDAPSLIQDLGYPTWSEDLNNGFIYSISSGAVLGGDSNFLWFNSPAAGPATITFTPEEQFKNGMFTLSGIVFDKMLNADIIRVTITGHTAAGTSVTSYVEGTTTAQFNAITLSGMDQLVSFDVCFERISASGSINSLAIDSFTISNTAAANLAPIFTSATVFSIHENAAAGGTILYDAQANNGEGSTADAGVTYSITGGTAATYFSINPTTGEVTLNATGDAALNYEAQVSHTLTITADDGSVSNHTTNHVITINVINDDDTAPVITSNGGGASANITINENITAVTTVTATDTDTPGALTYSLAGGTEEADFAINSGTGVLTFKVAPNYEVKTSYQVIVRVSDGTRVATQTLSISINDVNEATPVIQSNGGGGSASISMNENTTAVSTISATDADTNASLSYSISGGVDASEFTINATTGALVLKIAADYETKTSYAVMVEVTDGSFTDTQAITVSILNQNDNAPVITSNAGGGTATLTIDENTTSITTVTASDTDMLGGLAYSISGGAEQAAFTINTSSGVLILKTAPDYEQKTSYVVIVQVSDGAQTDSQTLTIQITDLNDETPVITSNGGGATASISISENTKAVTTVIATDADSTGSISYAITGGDDSSAFSINAVTGVLTLLSNADYEVKQLYNVIVEANDGLYKDSQTITVTVLNENDSAPNIISSGGGATAYMNINENTISVTTVAATDADGLGAISYSITGGADATSFALNATTGVLTFKTAPNYEVKNSYEVIITATDGTYSDTQNITLTIINTNDMAPVISSGGGGDTATISINENTTAVTTVTATDQDGLGALSYSISGGADVDYFSINASSGLLAFKNAADYEDKASYSVEIAVSDGVNTDTQTITVELNNLDDTPPLITSNGGGTAAEIKIDENTTGVTTIVATDVDTTKVLNYSVTGGADIADFTINSTSGVLAFLSAPDYETKPTYHVIVTVSDGTQSDTMAITVTIQNVEDVAPVITSNSGGATANINVVENSSTVTIVTATDEDAFGTLVYSITGGADATDFAINSASGVLTFKQAPDFETKTSYEVIVKVSDGIQYATQNIVITITDVIENVAQAPIINNQKNEISEEEIINIDLTQGDHTDSAGNIDIPVSIEEFMKLASNNERNDVGITVKLPEQFSKEHQNTGLILNAELLESAKQTDLNLAVTFKDEKDKERFTWTFDNKNLKASGNDIGDVNLAINVSTIGEYEDIAKDLGNEEGLQGIVLNFGHDGVLPSQASVRIYVGDQEGVTAGNKVYLYHYNHDTKKLDTLPFGSDYIVDKDGYVTINILHCSDYIILPEEAKAEQSTSLIEQIIVTPLKKSLYIGDSKKSTAIQIALPSTLEFVDSFTEETSQKAIGAVTATFQSGDKKIATVDASGRITLKGAGNVVITTTIKLFDGSTKAVKTTLTMKEPYIKLTEKINVMELNSNFTFKAATYGLDTKNIVWTTTRKSVIVINKTTGKATAKTAGTDYVVATSGKVVLKIKVVVK